MIKKFLNLGYQPLANSYLRKKQINKKEKKFKLEIVFNDKNFLVSINKKIPTKEIANLTFKKRSKIRSSNMRN